MKKIFQYSSIILISAAILHSCKSELKSPEATAGSANFTKYVAVGNSLTAGYADGGLYLEGQKVAYPNLIAEQIKASGLGANDFTSPFFPEDQRNGSGYVILKGFTASGSPKTANVQTALAYDFSKPNPIAGGFYFKPYAGAAFTNFGIPGIRLSNIDLAGYGFANAFMERIAGANKASKYIDWVASQNATFFSCWLGNNDVLGYATSGGVFNSANLDGITETPLFSTLYGLAIAKLTLNGAKGVVATIPDVTSIPYFNTVLPKVVTSSLKAAFPLLPPPSADTRYVVCYRSGSGQIKELNDSALICLTADSIGVSKGALPKGIGVQVISSGQIVGGYPLNNNDVLDFNEQQLAKNAVSDFNNIIIATAAKYNLALCDANAFLTNVKTGIIVDGTGVNASYVSGGAFSMDGVHLTPRGNAIAANAFIDAINAKYGSNIPKVNVTKYQGVKVQ
jgi:hypothetical protein